MFEYLDRIQEFCVTVGDLLRHHGSVEYVCE